jgi:hypothetical protein
VSLPALSGAVEGPTDEPVLRRIIASRGALVHRVQVAQGKQNLQKKLPGYNAAARRSPWIVLVDLNGAYPCPRALADDWLPEPSLLMRLRVVVRSVEAWLLADRERFASTFAIPLPRVPADPDGLPHAKQSLLASVAHARRRDVREDMLPRPGSARSVGPAYTSRVVEDVANTAAGWRPEVAAMSSPSLASCLRRLDELISAAKP